ncbi:MAG: cadmium-translocating P-type ATPase [Actinomycetota bacterium]|jgi:heavy metal translocating P-type ATPase
MPNNLTELEIEGMTCTACARRVEKSLNKVPGVSAYVDFATEKAHLQFDSALNLDLVKKAVEDAGYKVGEGKPELQALKPKLWIGSVLSALAMAFAMIPQLSFPDVHWLVFALSTPVFFYVAAPFHIAAIKNLRHLSSTMDTLVSLGSTVAYAYSVYLIFSGMHHTYFEVAAVVPTVVLIGRYIEVRARRSATDSVRALLSAIPQKALIERDGMRVEIDTATIKQGDLVFVAAGERVPVDGVLQSANATLDTSTLTGESLPVELVSGALVTAGTTSLSGEIRVLAQSTSSTSRLSQIADLVREATSQKTKLASLTDRISAVFVPAVIFIALATFLVWGFLLGDWTKGFEAAVAVLVIACPCALGIAVPMSLVVATSVGAKRSVVIRNPDSLRDLASTKTIIFDKTGTLTDGELRVVNSRGLGGVGAATMLAYAAAVEAGSKHPVAKAISKLSNAKTATDVKEIAGIGLVGVVDGTEVHVGKPQRYENQAELDEALSLAGPNTLVVVSWEGWAHGLIELSDELRPGAKEVISDLSELGFETMLLSGDAPRRVEEVAKLLGITSFQGGVSPEEKLEVVKRTKDSVMIGDGINDVAALSAARASIAMGSGAHAAQAASSITILDDSPDAIPFALKLAKRTHRNIFQNLGWAFGYNILLIPVAAMGLLNPMLAGAAMAFSSVSVVANALRLRWQDGSKTKES